jgi:Protein of unknown function (DUF3093).
MVAALLLSAPMVLLAALPFSAGLAYVLAFLVPVGLILFFVLRAPRITLGDDYLEVGRMRVPVSALGEAYFSKGTQLHLSAVQGLAQGLKGYSEAI